MPLVYYIYIYNNLLARQYMRMYNSCKHACIEFLKLPLYIYIYIYIAGGLFSREGNFTNCQEHLMINLFSKHFDGKFHKWQLIHEICESFCLE